MSITNQLLTQALEDLTDQPSKIIQQNLETAYEQIPESFFPISLLMVDVHIKGLHFKAMIDTGAQISLMSEFVTEACDLGSLIDRNCRGLAKGVGQAEFTGKIHCLDVYLGTKVIPCSFRILKSDHIKMIIGLDMLISHGVLIDLKNRCLIIDDERIEFVVE